MTEAQIHKSVLAYLRTVLPRALVFHPPNSLDMGGDPKAKAIAQAKAKAMGMLPGLADICVLSGGVFVALEVKREGAYAKPHQRDVGALVEANGGFFAVVRSVEDAREALRDAGIITREVMG